MISYTV